MLRGAAPGSVGSAGSVIIIGSGIAGLSAALRASRFCDVTVVTKSGIAESNTLYAQGGIAAALFADDSVAAHVGDTLRAGAGLNSREAVEAMCAEGPERVRELMALGVAFDRADGSGETGDPVADLARGLEAAHSSARVLHAGGDATGAAIEGALVARVLESRASVIENTMVTDLIIEDGAVCGVETLDEDGVARRIFADAVIIASGGAGQLFAHTTNPPGATGDGVAAAWRAGAELADVEFYQFHPTALAAGRGTLVSEAVRGDGAVLRNRNGERFMTYAHPDADLAPRDIVARAIATEMAAQDGDPVVLDATALGAGFLRRRFPTIDAATRAAGLDWSHEPIPVTPAAHYWMGGIRTDVHGRASLPGLYAIGEAACTGAQGANRLASNSLLEGLVFAARATDALAADVAGGGRQTTIAASESAGAAPRAERKEPSNERHSRASLQRLLWAAAGVQREGRTLTEAVATLADWPHPTLSDIRSHEDGNLLDLARVITAAALAREESRGAHYRSDFPSTDETARHTVVHLEGAAAC